MADSVVVNYQQTGASQKLNALGMREMQSRAFDARNAQYLLVKAPPASGKSRALMFIGLDKIENQGIKKVIVAVPERSIGVSFDSTVLKKDGFFRDWVVKPQWNLTNAPGVQKTKAFADFMASPDEVLVCTHATLRFAYDDLGREAFANCLIAVDEFHHASADENSRLGEVVRGLIAAGNAHIIAMTGSYFRGDTIPILRAEDEAQFARVNYTYYEQLNGYTYLRTLGIGYHFYRGRYVDAINEVLDPNLKTIVHIPSVNASESTKDKLNEVDQILDHLGEFVETDQKTGFYLVRQKDGQILKVADLVNDELVKREKVMLALRNIKSRDDVDIIIALGMAKEGFDWVWCEHVLTVGYRGSLTEIIQIIGRSTRDAENKTHAQFTNLIAEPDASEDRVAASVNNMLKAISCSLLMEQVLAPDFKFKTKSDSDTITGDRPQTAILPTGDGNTIFIKGFAEPSTPRVRQILLSDLNDLSATILQDDTILRATMNPGEFAPEVITQVLVPKVIETRYPDLNPEEIEEVRQAVVANTIFKNPETQIVQEGDNKFVRFADKFINIDSLSIDLIDSINPFQRAYEILSKTVTADVLKTIHMAIVSTKIPITAEEAVMLWPRINAFREANGCEPNLESQDPLERRMAEGLAWLRVQKQKKLNQA